MILNRVNKILSSDECASFSIAFLIHAVLLLLLSITFSLIKDDSPSVVIISSIPIDEQEIDESQIIVDDIHKFDSESTSFTETDVISDIEDTSLKVDNIDIPSAIEPQTEIGIGIPESQLLSDSLSGVSTNIGSDLSTQSSTAGALDRLTVEIIDNASIE